MTEYKDSRDDVMTYTANWILKHAGSRSRALQLRKEFMSNKQWVREDVVKEYRLQQQKLKDEKISEIGSLESIKKNLESVYEKRKQNSKSSGDEWRDPRGRMILFGDGSKWLSNEQIDSTFSE